MLLFFIWKKFKIISKTIFPKYYKSYFEFCVFCFFIMCFITNIHMFLKHKSKHNIFKILKMLFRVLCFVIRHTYIHTYIDTYIHLSARRIMKTFIRCFSTNFWKLVELTVWKTSQAANRRLSRLVVFVCMCMYYGMFVIVCMCMSVMYV
jgi:hypothetical protein